MIRGTFCWLLVSSSLSTNDGYSGEDSPNAHIEQTVQTARYVWLWLWDIILDKSVILRKLSMFEVKLTKCQFD